MSTRLSIVDHGILMLMKKMQENPDRGEKQRSVYY